MNKNILETPVDRRRAGSKKLALRQKAYKFISENRAGALATADESGQPHVAVVYFIVNPDLSLYFSTRIEARKYHNISDRSTVALAFYDELNMATIQLTGIAQRVETLAVEQQVLHELLRLRYGDPNWPVPAIKLFEHGVTNELAVIKVTPLEMTYGSFATNKKGVYKPFFEEVI